MDYCALIDEKDTFNTSDPCQNCVRKDSCDKATEEFVKWLDELIAKKQEQVNDKM